VTLQADQREVQLRIPLDPDNLGYLDPLLDEFAELLDQDAGEFCDDCEEEDDEIAYYLYGPDQDRLISVARTAVSGYELPPGVYAVKTAEGHESDGDRIPL
jgi:hypothetical protein